MSHHHLPSLEDRAFGPATADDDGVRTWSDSVAAYMFPVVVTAVLILVVGYSLQKGIDYQEVFRNNQRYRTGLLVVNALAVVVACVLVAYSVNAEAQKRLLLCV